MTVKYRLDNTAASYYKDLRLVVRDLKRRINNEVVPAMKQDDWAEAVSTAIDRLKATYALMNYMQISDRFIKRALQNKMSIDVYGQSERMANYIVGASKQNALLIKSIPERHLDQVSNIVLGNMRQGMRSSYIIEQLEKEYGVSYRRAKIIARDQTSKINGELARVRQEDAGFEYFQWITSKDERTRHSHTKAANTDVGYGKGVYRWDDLPIVDNEPSYPGSPILCRCFAKPIRNPLAVKNK